MDDRLLVIAGNQDEFNYWKEKNWLRKSDLVYVCEMHHVCGRSNCSYITVGTWVTNPLVKSWQYLFTYMHSYNIWPVAYHYDENGLIKIEKREEF